MYHVHVACYGNQEWCAVLLKSEKKNVLFNQEQFLNKVCVCSVVSGSANPLTVAHQALLSMEFSRQEYWSGLTFPTLGHLPNSWIKFTSLVSPASAG